MRNVAVVGGCSVIPGLVTRLKSELRTIASEMNLTRTSPRPVTLCFVQCFRTDRRKAWQEMPDRQAAKRHLLRYNVGLLRLRVLPRIAEYAGLRPVVLCGGADAVALGGTVLLHRSLQHLQGTNQDVGAMYSDGKTWATAPKLPFGLASRYKFLSKNAYEEMGPCLSHVAFALDENEHRKYDRWMDNVYICPQALEQLEYDWQSLVSAAKKNEKGEEKQQQVGKQQEDGKEVTEQKETTC